MAWDPGEEAAAIGEGVGGGRGWRMLIFLTFQPQWHEMDGSYWQDGLGLWKLRYGTGLQRFLGNLSHGGRDEFPVGVSRGSSWRGPWAQDLSSSLCIPWMPGDGGSRSRPSPSQLPGAHSWDGTDPQVSRSQLGLLDERAGGAEGPPGSHPEPLAPHR